MSDRFAVSNQQRINSNLKQQQQQTGPLQREALKIGHSASFRGVHTNIGPIQTGYDHMYATDTEDGQPQLQQQAELIYADIRAGDSTETITSALSEVRFLKEFLLMHLDLIQQQNDDILLKDNFIIKLKEENAALKQRIQSLEHQSPATLASYTAPTNPDDLPVAEQQSNQQTALGDYSPESIPPTEDVLAPDVGDNMTLADTVAPQSAKIIIRDYITLATPTTVIEQPVDPCASASGVLACLPEASVQSNSSVISSSSITRAPSEVVIIEDDSTDVDLPTEQSISDLVLSCDSVGTVEPPSEVGTGCETILTSEHTITTPTSSVYTRSPTLSSPPFIPTPNTTEGINTTTVAAITTTTAPARYSVVCSTVVSDSGESSARNLRMSIRRKRLCSGSSQSNNDSAPVEENKDSNETKIGESSFSLGTVRRKDSSKSKRKRLNGHILTFPQEYVTRVGEANVDVLRHQALADEVIKASNLEVPHWRVKVYADSYHLEGTENLDDEVFLKRHARLENDERRRKRWDVQRIREQRIVDKLKQRQTKSHHHVNADHTHSKITTNGGADGRPDSLDGYDMPASLWPAPQHDLQYIEVTDQLPVGAFGMPLPVIIPGEFSIPWLGSEKAQSVTGETDTSLNESPNPVAQNNNGRKSGGSRKSSRESGGSAKRRSRR